MAVVGDRQAKLRGRPLQRHRDRALCLARKSILDGVRNELVHNQPNRNCPIGREGHALDFGLEHDGRVAFFVYRCNQIAAQLIQIGCRLDSLKGVGFG